MITTRARCRIVLRSLQSSWDARDAAVEFHDFTPRAGMRGYKPHLYGGPHAGRLNVVCKTNEIKPQDYVELSRALLISFNCWCFSACHSMIDILPGHRLLIRKEKSQMGSQWFICIETSQIFIFFSWGKDYSNLTQISRVSQVISNCVFALHIHFIVFISHYMTAIVFSFVSICSFPEVL